MTNKDYTPDINFLYEMGNIRLIERMWRRFNTPNFANVTEHHFRVFWIAMVIAARENDGTLDTGKVAKLSLMHDITESRICEVDYISRQYVERKEEMAISDILDETSVKDEFLALWHEYEKRESLESRIVKDADTLDIDLELMEQAASGHTIKQAKQSMRDDVAAHKLYTETAREMYAAIQASDPHDWWRTSKRNRQNAGDWKDTKSTKTKS